MADDSAGEGGTDSRNGEGGPDTVPTVDIDLYQLSVSVSGQADDDLVDVEETARNLMEYLVDRSERLEEHPDERGLG